MRVLLLGGTAEARALAKASAPADRHHQLAGGPGARPGPAGRPGTHRRLRRRRRAAALVARRTRRRRRRRHPPVRGNHDSARRPSVRRITDSASGTGPPGVGSGHCHCRRIRQEAAETVAQQGYSRVFLTTGRSGVKAFADSDAWFLIRAVTAPDSASLPRHHELVLSRGPYRYDDEFALLREHASTPWSPRTAAAT